MHFNKTFIFFILSLLFFTTIDAAVVKKGKNNYKAFYNTSYGRLSFDEILIKKQIARDEFLSNIFEKNSLGLKNLNNLTALPDSIFNEKRIKEGNHYGIVYDVKQEKLAANKFIYEKNKVDYLVANLQEEFIVSLYKKPIEIIEKVSEGTILSSLYITMKNNGINPLLAVNLSEIYAWTIDFYKIQKGDDFKIVYLEKFVEGKSLNEFDIKASYFTHRGFQKQAYFFKTDEDVFGNYFDENGENLRRTFLKAPVKYSRISSVYSPKRFHPVQKRWKAHLGTDYAAPRGTPIYATADGVVIASTYRKYNGNYVKIKHNSVYTTQYLHMSKRAVKKGSYVQQGQLIGYVGSTGLATGPHVCYRFWKNGRQVDANKQDLPKAEPLDAKYLEKFLNDIIPLQDKLNNKNNLEYET